MKYNFYAHYAGPLGPHLAYLTKFSRSKEHNESGTMHPTGRHNHLWKTRYLDKNGNPIPITGPRNSSRKGKLAKASKALNSRRVGWPSGGQAVGYTLPGSMQS